MVNEECYPYIAAQNVCKISNDDTLITANCELPVKVNRTLMYKMGPAFSLNNETDIMAEIKDRGTVQGKGGLTSGPIASGVIMQKLMLVVSMLLPQPSCECIGTFSRTAVEFTAIRVYMSCLSMSMPVPTRRHPFGSAVGVSWRMESVA